MAIFLLFLFDRLNNETIPPASSLSPPFPPIAFFIKGREVPSDESNPKTRASLLIRVHDPADQTAWHEFVRSIGRSSCALRGDSALLAVLNQHESHRVRFRPVAVGDRREVFRWAVRQVRRSSSGPRGTRFG